MVQQIQLILSFAIFFHQQISTVRICMHEPVFVDHPNNDLGKLFPYLLQVDFSHLHFFDFVYVKPMDELHDKHFSCRFVKQIGYMNIFKFFPSEHLFHSFHINCFQPKIQLFLNVYFKLFNQPLKFKLLKQKLGDLHEGSHKLEIV